jgi:hypothetical protein
VAEDVDLAFLELGGQLDAGHQLQAEPLGGLVSQRDAGWIGPGPG